MYLFRPNKKICVSGYTLLKIRVGRSDYSFYFLKYFYLPEVLFIKQTWDIYIFQSVTWWCHGSLLLHFHWLKAHTNGRNKSQHCCVLLGFLANNVASVCMGLKVWPVSNYTQQLPTSANTAVVPCKRTQHVGPNNAACSWPTMLRPFAWAFNSLISADLLSAARERYKNTFSKVSFNISCNKNRLKTENIFLREESIVKNQKWQ